MAEFEFTAEEIEAAERIALYNGGSYDAATNRYGFADGGYNFNQMEQARDVTIIARAALRMAESSRVDAERTRAAAILIAGGPVSSVDGKSGAVVLNLDPRLDEALWLAFTQ